VEEYDYGREIMVVLDQEEEIGICFAALVERSVESCGSVIDVVDCRMPAARLKLSVIGPILLFGLLIIV
jgi:hypothetical protein